MKKRLFAVIASATLLITGIGINPANANGLLDSSFDTDGKVTTAIGSSHAFASSVAIQSDGKIVALGSSYNGSNYDFALARYDTNGALDTSFDTDGKVTTGIGASAEEARSVAIQSDGKIVVAGYSYNGSNYDFAVLRYGTPPALIVDDTAAQAKAAAAQREAEKRVARAEILDKFKKSETVSIEVFVRAEIAGVTKENLESIQGEISAIPEASRTDLAPILKIARKYEVVGMVASDRVVSIYSKSLIEIGLIAEDNKHKAALTAAIKKLPASERSSYAAIKAAIDAEMAEIQARKDRLTAILARIAARQAG